MRATTTMLRRPIGFAAGLLIIFGVLAIRAESEESDDEPTMTSAFGKNTEHWAEIITTTKNLLKPYFPAHLKAVLNLLKL